MMKIWILMEVYMVLLFISRCRFLYVEKRSFEDLGTCDHERENANGSGELGCSLKCQLERCFWR